MVFWKIPAVVLAFLTWWAAPPASLADAARHEALRRQSAPRAARSLTNQDLPPAPVVEASPPDVAAAEPPATAAAGEPKEDKVEKHDEKWWRDQITTAFANLDRDKELEVAMQSRINALTTDWTNRDDPAQKAVLFDERQKALAELSRIQKDIIADSLAIDGIRESARRQGVPAGWIRGS